MNLYLLFVVLVWGVNYSVVKGALYHFSPLSFNGLRFVLAPLVLLFLMRIRGQKLPEFRNDRPLLILVGLVGHFIYQITYVYGIRWTTAGNTSLILAGTPIFTALFSHALGHEKVSRKMWAGILTSFTGVTLVVLGSAELTGPGKAQFRGDLTVVAAAVLWSVFVVASAPLIKKYGALPTCAAALCVGAPFLLTASLPSLLSQNWRLVTAADWGALFYSAVLSIAVSQILWYRAIGELGNARTSVYSNLVPLVGVLAAWPLLGETPRLLQIAGAAAILSGAFLTGTGAPPESAVPKLP